jgi:hypothetical protein
MFKYRFKVIYQPKEFREVCKFVEKMDLDIGEVGIEQVFQFTSAKDMPIVELKSHIKSAFLSGEMTILHIEGGKIE